MCINWVSSHSMFASFHSSPNIVHKVPSGLLSPSLFLTWLVILPPSATVFEEWTCQWSFWLDVFHFPQRVSEVYGLFFVAWQERDSFAVVWDFPLALDYLVRLAVTIRLRSSSFCFWWDICLCFYRLPSLFSKVSPFVFFPSFNLLLCTSISHPPYTVLQVKR